jgi:hypothetical protein
MASYLPTAHLDPGSLRASARPGEFAHTRLEFLAKVSLLLAESSDYDTILRAIAHVMVPAVADLSATDLIEENCTENRRP